MEQKANPMIKKFKKTLTAPLILLIMGCETKTTAIAKIEQINQSEISGLAVFTKHKNGIKVKLSLNGKKNTTLAVHIHEGMECDKVDGKSAKGHWNPTGEKHGRWGTSSFHSGDIGNIAMDKNGVGSYELIDTVGRWSIGGYGETNILDRSMIIHDGVDDGKTQPSGAAGGRVACGLITGGNK